MSLLECEEARVLLEDAVLNASTVRGCRGRLTRFLQRYLPLFYRTEQRKHAKLVIEGKLSHLDRKTSEPIAHRAGVERKPVQQFVGAGKWDDEAVMAELRRHVAEEFDDPDATLVLDGSSFPKKGIESCGVARQWCGRNGKIDNCQVGVFLSCVSRGRIGPLGRRLYLPRDWAQDTVRRRKCHVPHGVRFAEKWRLGLKLIGESHVPHGWITADDEFGRVTEFRAELRRRRRQYVVDVPCNTLVRIVSAEDGAATASDPGRKRRRAAKKKVRRGRPRLPLWVRVDEWAAKQPAAVWRRIEVRAGEKGPLVVEVLDAMAQTRGKGKTQERLLVIRTVEANPQTHYCLSNAASSVPIETIVDHHDDRHRIEEMFELGNGEVGLDHYEVRSWVGWHHHMTLSLLALWFLTRERQKVGGKNPGDHRATSADDLQPPAATARSHGNRDRRDDQRSVAA
jgi:SRSO17 transposase